MFEFVSAFYPVAGLTFAFAYVFGPRVWPAMFLGSSAYFVPDLFGLFMNEMGGYEFASVLAQNLRQVVTYGLGAYVFRQVLHISGPLEASLDVWRFLSVALPVSLLSAVGGVWLFVVFDSFEISSYLDLGISFWAGDASGLLIAGPVFMALFSAWNRDISDKQATQLRDVYRDGKIKSWLILLAATAVITLVVDLPEKKEHLEVQVTRNLKTIENNK